MTDRHTLQPTLAFEMETAETAGPTRQYGDLPRAEQPMTPPFEPEGPTTAYASALPHISCLIINVKPGSKCRLLELCTIGRREELLHGTRKRFGLTRNTSLLERRSITALFEYLHGEIDAQTAARQLVPSQIANYHIVTVQEGYLEAVDQYLQNRAMEDREQLSRDVDAVIRGEGEDADRLIAQLSERQQELETNRTEARLEEVYDVLESLGEEYSPTVAQHTADAALNIPYAIAPVDVVSVPSWSLLDSDDPTEQLRDRLWKRLETAAQTVRELDEPETEGRQLVEKLQTDLQNVDELVATTAAGEESITELTIPLLDVPKRIADAEAQDAVRSVSDPLDQMLASAFQLPGNFGGVVFWNGRDDPSWQINPLIDNQGYRERWEAAYVGEILLEQLKNNYWRRDTGKGTLREITCPICHFANGQRYAGCVFNTLTDRLDDKMGALLDTMRLVDNDYDRDLFAFLDQQYGGQQHE